MGYGEGVTPLDDALDRVESSVSNASTNTNNGTPTRDGGHSEGSEKTPWPIISLVNRAVTK